MLSRFREWRRWSDSGSAAGKGGPLFLAAWTFVNASSFLFHVVISRIIGPAEYGALGALLGIIMVLQVPSGALQVAIAQEVAGRREQAKDEPLYIGRLLSTAVAAALLASLVVLVAAPVLRSFLHLPSVNAVVLLGTMLVPIIIGIVPRAVLLGELRFRPYAYGLLIGASVKLLAGIALAKAGYGVTGAIAATVLGESAAALFLLIPLRHVMVEADPEVSLSVRPRDAGAAGSAFTAYWILLTIDTVLVRHQFSRLDSGFYAAASTAAQGALFLPSAIVQIAFPRFAASEGRSMEARRALAQALLAVGVVAFGVASFIALEPGFVIGLIFGQSYAGSATAAGALAFAAAAMAIVNVLVYYLLASRSSLPHILWPVIGLVAVLIIRFGSSLEQVALIMLGVGAALAATLFVGTLRKRPRRLVPVSHEGARRLWDLSEPTLDLSIVVPFYNPGPRFRPSIERLIDVLEDAGSRFEVIAVSDGSSDASVAEIRDLRPDIVHIVRHESNMGKGFALRTGLAMAEGRYVGFIDADGDIDASVLPSFLTLIRLYDPDIVLGSKRHPLSEVEYPALRRVYSWGYQQLIRLLFHLNVRDTQTGVKIVRRQVLAEALPLMVEKRFAFDLELFVVARHLGYQRFFEAPVSIGERFSSTVSPRAVRRMMGDTVRVFGRLHFLGFYDQALPGIGGRPDSDATPTLSPSQSAAR